MDDPSPQDLVKLGAAFFALGVKPEYTSDVLVKWMDNQANKKPDIPIAQPQVQTYVLPGFCFLW